MFLFGCCTYINLTRLKQNTCFSRMCCSLKCISSHPNPEHCRRLPSCSCQKAQSHPNGSIPSLPSLNLSASPIHFISERYCKSLPFPLSPRHHGRAGCSSSLLIALSGFAPSSFFFTHLQGASFSYYSVTMTSISIL